MRKLALLLGAVLAAAPLAAQPPGVPILDLRPDPTFRPHRLPVAAEGDAVQEFAVLGGNVYFTLHRGDGPYRISRLEPGRSEDRVEHDLLPQCNALDLHRSAGALRFFDHASRSLATYEPDSGRLDLRPVGLSTVSGFRVFAGGRSLVYSVHLHPEPLAEEDLKRLDDAEVRKYAGRLDELRDSAVFLMDPEMRLIRPLLPHYRPETRALHADPTRELSREEAWEDNMRRVFVRMSGDGRVAAVFRRHLPGIELFGADGARLASLRHPGEGIVIPEEGPVPGARAYVQSDVLVAGDHVLAADLFGGTLWKVDLRGRVRAGYRMPFPVVEMEREGRFLYLRGRDGELGRYLYPPGRG